MANKLEYIKELFKEESISITNSPENWLKFLDTASKNYKYSFNEQVLIYAQRPDAIACADIDTWNKRLHRWIKKGSKGIALLENKDGNDYLQHVFDISDTYDKFGRKVDIWKLNKNFTDEIIEDLESSFGELEMKNNLSEAIISASYNMVEDNFQDYFNELKRMTDNSYLEGIDDDNLSYYYRKLMSNSVAYMIMKRCDLDPLEYLEVSDFQEIVNFNTIDVVSSIGIATSDISENALREIYSTNLELNKKLKNKNQTFVDSKNQNYNVIKEIQNNKNQDIVERSENYEYNLSQRRGLSNTRPNNRGEGENKLNEIWQNEVEISNRTQESPMEQPNNEGRITESSIGNRPVSEQTSNGISAEISRTEPGKREDEIRQSNVVGSNDEQLQKSSRRNGNEGLDLQLNLFTQNRTEQEQDNIIEEAVVNENTPALFISGEEIEEILKVGSNIEHGKFRIYEHLTNPFNNEKAEDFLKNEYGLGGYSIENGWVDFSSKGIEITKGNLLNSNVKKLLNWNYVAKQINEYIKNDTYFTENEVNEYLKYQDIMKKDFAENYVNFCYDNNIYDWEEPAPDEEFDYDENIRIYKSKEEHIKDIIKELDNPTDIQAEIDYLNSVKLAESGTDEKLDHSIDVFIENFNRYYKVISKQVKTPKISNTEIDLSTPEAQEFISQAQNINNLFKAREENGEPSWSFFY